MPLVCAIGALVLHGFFAISVRGRMYEALDSLPEDVRRDLGWVALHEAKAAHATRRLIRAKARLAHWPLPRSPRIPAHVYQAERAYKRHFRTDTILGAVLILAFALADRDAWIISLILGCGFGALLILRKRFLDPWPDIPDAA